MAFLGGLKGLTKTPKFLRPLLGDTWLDEAGTVGGFAVGGPPGAAAGRGVGKFAYTGDLKKGLQGAAEGYAMGAGAQALGLKGGGAKLLGGTGKAATGKAGALAAKGKAAGDVMAAARPGGVRGFVGGALDWLKDNPELALGGLTAGLGAVEGARNDAYRREGMDLLRGRMEAGAPLEAEARRLLLAGGPKRRSLSAIYADPSNPFYREVA